MLHFCLQLLKLWCKISDQFTFLLACWYLFLTNRPGVTFLSDLVDPILYSKPGSKRNILVEHLSCVLITELFSSSTASGKYC